MKRKLMLLSEYLVVALVILFLCLISGSWTKYVHYVCFGIMGVLVATWLFLYVRGKYKGFLILLSLLFVQPAFAAGTVQDCASKQGPDVLGCIFETNCSNNQRLLCEWARKLDPTKNYSDKEQREFKEAATIAGALTGMYDGLDAVYKTHNCSAGATTSNDCYCCARILETKYHTWLVKHGGTGDSNIQTVPLILASQASRCWPCDIVLIFIVVMEHIIINSAVPLSALALKLLAIIFLFWLVLRVLRLVLDLSTAKTLWQDVLKRTLFVSCVALILGNVVATGAFKGSMMQGLYIQIVNPVMELIMGLNESFAKQAFTHSSFFGAYDALISEKINAKSPGYSDSYCSGDSSAVRAIESRVAHYFNDAAGGLGGLTYLVSDRTDEFGTSGRVFSSELIQSFMCVTQRVFNQIAPLTAMGSVIVSSEAPKFENMFSWTRLFKFFIDPPSLVVLFYGLLFYIPCVLFSWLVAFEILDIFLRMLFVFPLTPLWITCAAFPVTRKYAIKTCKFLFSLLMDFMGVTIGLGVVLAMVEQFLPNGFAENITCWMFDTVRETDATTCNIRQVLSENFFIYSNKYYAEHLYRELTKEHGLRIICVVFCMYFLGKKVFFGVRSAFKELLDAKVGTSLGGSSIFGGASMDAQKQAREGVGFTIGLIPGVGTIGSAIVNGGGKLTDSAASAGTKYYNVAANAAARGINRAGDAVEPAASAAGTVGMAKGKLAMAAGKGLCTTGIGAILGVPLILFGGALYGGGFLLQKASPVLGFVGKVSSRVASTAVKISKVVARVGIGTTKHVVKTVGSGATTATKRLFFLSGKGSGGKKSDKK